MISLEDNVGDIIGKAQRGLGISDSELEKKAGVDLQTIRKVREGDVDEQALQRVAPVLGLSAGPLCELAKGEWRPERIDERAGFAQFNTRYHDMTVNAYLVWDPASRVAAAFDTGADCSEMLRFANRHKLNVQLFFLPMRIGIMSRTCRVCARRPVRMFLSLPANLSPAPRPSTKESTSTSEIWKLIHG